MKKVRHPILSRFRFPLTILFAAASGASLATSFSQQVSHGPGRSLGAGGQLVVVTEIDPLLAALGMAFLSASFIVYGAFRPPKRIRKKEPEDS
jgi:hypothetical protein